MLDTGASRRGGSSGVDKLKTTLKVPPPLSSLPSTRSHHWGFYHCAKKGCCSFYQISVILTLDTRKGQGPTFVPLVLIQQRTNLVPQGRNVHVWCCLNFLFPSASSFSGEEKNKTKTPISATTWYGTSFFALVRIFPSLRKSTCQQACVSANYINIVSNHFTFGPLTALSRGC